MMSCVLCIGCMRSREGSAGERMRGGVRPAPHTGVARRRPAPHAGAPLEPEEEADAGDVGAGEQAEERPGGAVEVAEEGVADPVGQLRARGGGGAVVAGDRCDSARAPRMFAGVVRNAAGSALLRAALLAQICFEVCAAPLMRDQ